jgi:ABC-type sulfate transport system permease subunit
MLILSMTGGVAGFTTVVRWRFLFGVTLAKARALCIMAAFHVLSRATS